MSEHHEMLKSAHAESLTWRQRLRRPDLWKEQLIDTSLWLVLGLMVTHVIALSVPGYPQAIWTESVKRGVYWIDRTDGIYARGKFVAFDFQPKLKYLQERFGVDRRYVKQIVGVEGDTVTVTSDWEVEVCPSAQTRAIPCQKHGVVMKSDTAGRPMQSWVPPGASYVVKPGELWVMGPHPKSLDSRYNGPITFDQVKGTAQLVIAFD